MPNEQLRGLHSAITPVRDEWKIRSKDGEDRYELIGVPCGFPVAVFGDHCDAAFDLECRRSLPALLDEIDRMRSALADVVDAVRDYLPPDGIDAQSCLNRVIGAVDNPQINPIIKEIDNGRS